MFDNKDLAKKIDMVVDRISILEWKQPIVMIIHKNGNIERKIQWRSKVEEELHSNLNELLRLYQRDFWREEFGKFMALRGAGVGS